VNSRSDARGLILVGDLRQDCDEIVAPHATDRIGPAHAGFEATRDGDQDGIAH